MIRRLRRLRDRAAMWTMTRAFLGDPRHRDAPLDRPVRPVTSWPEPDVEGRAVVDIARHPRHQPVVGGMPPPWGDEE